MNVRRPAFKYEFNLTTVLGIVTLIGMVASGGVVYSQIQHRLDAADALRAEYEEAEKEKSRIAFTEANRQAEVLRRIGSLESSVERNSDLFLALIPKIEQLNTSQQVTREILLRLESEVSNNRVRQQSFPVSDDPTRTP